MAALEQIRKRAVLLTVVIGVALLAFILGDAERVVTSVFGNNNTIATVDGEKIDAIEFQNRFELANQQMQNQGQKFDAAVLQQQVIEQMISERLLDAEIERVGINVSDAELTEAMTGNNANMLVMQFAQSMGIPAPAQLYDFLFNPAKYGATPEQVAEAKAQWLNLKEDVLRNLKYTKLQQLIAGSIQANKLDREQLSSEDAVTTSIAYVKQGYDALKGDQYKPTEAELQAQYDKDKYLYQLEEEVRKIHYVAVDVVPSKADLDKSAAMIGETLDSLRLENGVDRVRSNSELLINEGKVRLNDIIDGEVKKFVETAEVGQVSEPKFENSTSTYSIVKLVSKSAEVDSVKINMVTVQGAKTLQDSVLNLLNNGKTLADLKEIQGVDGQEDQWQVIMNANDSLRHKLLNAPAGYFALESTDEATFLCKVVEKKAPKTMYNIAQIEHKVYPSTETVNGLTDKLQEFINTNNTSALFEENAVKAGYNCVETTLTPSTAQIDRIESTRKAIQWAFEAKAGKVSAIFDKENNNKLLVVAVDDIYNEYAPLSDLQVNTAVSTKVMNDKKATEIMAKLEGKKTLDEFAQAMGVTEIDSTQVTFGQAFIPKIGTGEAELTAQVAAAKEGTVVGPIKGNTGVYAFVVTKSDARQREVTDLESDRTFAAYRGNQAVMQNAVAILRKAVKVEKDMIRFF